MELFSIRIQRTFQLVSTTMNTYNSKFLIFENAKVRKKKRGNNHLI